MTYDAVVVGAGVIGLTSAIRLAERGWRVNVISDRDPLDTTSAVAAAIWLPYRAAPEERVLAWSAASHAVFAGQACDPSSGVVLRTGALLWHSVPDPALAVLPLESVRALPADRALPSGVSGGAELELPVIEMPLYLRWLCDRLAALGVRVELRHVTALDETGAARVVVNATGLGARALARDGRMFPIQGQIVCVECAAVDRFSIAEDDTEGARYVIPRSRDVVVGGTAVEGSWDVDPSPVLGARLLERAVELEPRLAGARVLAHRVGLRPARPAVRLEAEVLGDRVVIHNYGHGGSGVTVAWGCAEEVVRLATQVA